MKRPAAGCDDLLQSALLGDTALLETTALEVRALIAAAESHGVAALVWQALERETGLGATLRAKLDPLVRGIVARELLVQRDLQSVLAALHTDGVPALVFKGSSLAYTIYPQPWLRSRLDTDVLIRKEDVTAASRVLEQCGYMRSDAISTGELVSHQIAFTRIDENGIRYVIDLHWKTSNPQLFADAMSFDELWSVRQNAAALGRAAYVPPPVASTVLACVHRLAHHQGHDRLIWLYDLKLLAATFSSSGWQELVALASAKRVAGLCLDGLREARGRVGGELPASVEEQLSASAPQEPSHVYLDRRIHKRDILISDLRVLPSWSDRVRLLREHVFPSRAFIQQRYGVRTRWLLPALYAHRLVTGAFRWVRT